MQSAEQMAGTDPIYSAEVEQRFRAPPAAGDLPPGDGVEVVAEAGSRAVGAYVQLRALVDGQRLAAVRFRAYGCPHLIAAASWAAEQLSGATPATLAAWDWQAAASALAVPPAKFGRLLVLQDAVRNLGIACARSAPSA
jgi:NifU-like protein involved in Fe-S cluster formation